jgi:HEAT repeat protein
VSLDRVLAFSLAVLLSAFLVCALVLFLYSWGRALQRVRYRATIGRARTALSAVIMDRDPNGVWLKVLQRTPEPVQRELLVDLSRSLSGASRESTFLASGKLGLTRNARRQLRSRHWWKRLHATRTMQDLEPGSRLFLPLLADPHPAVRAQAAEWAGHYPDPDVAAALLPLLDDVSSLSRYAVQDALLRIGAVCVDPLAAYLNERGGEAVIPALRVSLALAQPAFAGPAARLCHDDSADVRALAAQLLGTIGGANAADSLIACLTDKDERVRAAAANGLGRMSHWPAAAVVAELMRDSAWHVRRAAALALRRMGSPGTLLLRRMASDQDPFASDMANHVLELPAGTQVV